MSVITQSSAKARFSLANHIGHGLGLLISVGNVLVGISPEAREGDGYNGNIWIVFVVFGVIAVVALLASWITRSSTARRIGGVALVFVGVASLGVLFVPDIGTEGRIANSVGALLQFGAAALVLLPPARRPGEHPARLYHPDPPARQVGPRSRRPTAAHNRRQPRGRHDRSCGCGGGTGPTRPTGPTVAVLVAQESGAVHEQHGAIRKVRASVVKALRSSIAERVTGVRCRTLHRCPVVTVRARRPATMRSTQFTALPG